MSWLYLPSSCFPAQECSVREFELGSDTWASNIAPSCTLSGKLSPPASWRRAWKKNPWMTRLFGPMCAPSTLKRGAAKWISSLPDSRAKTSPLPAAVSGSTASDPASSLRLSGSLAIAVRNSSFWRTSAASLLPPPPLWTKPKGLSKSARPPESWENWPTAGGMRNGSLFQRPMWVPAMTAPAGSALPGAWMTPHGMSGMDSTGKVGSGGEFAKQVTNWATPDCNTSTYSNGQMGMNIREQASQWMTPNVPNGGRHVPEELVASKGQTEDGAKRTVGMESQAKYWSSPRATDGINGGPNQRGSKGDLMLPSMAAQWPTPAARDHKGVNSPEHVTSLRGGNKHMDQLANFVAYSPLVPVISDGQESSPACPGSPQHSASSKNSTPRLLTRRLNPNFGGWLMGWPLHWTSAIVRPSSNASGMESYRSALQLHLSCLFDDPEYSRGTNE